MGDTAMDSDTECTARGRPRLSLRPSLRLLLMPTTPTDMDSDTMDLDTVDSDTPDSDTAMDSDTMDSDTECTARGRPRLSLRLLLMPTTWADMDSDTVSDTTDSDTPDSDTAMDSDTMDSDTECTARGRPRLSLRLLLILTTDTDILVSDTPDTVTDTVSDTPDTVT